MIELKSVLPSENLRSAAVDLGDTIPLLITSWNLVSSRLSPGIFLQKYSHPY